jgi:hypothetical protein
VPDFIARFLIPASDQEQQHDNPNEIEVLAKSSHDLPHLNSPVLEREGWRVGNNTVF